MIIEDVEEVGILNSIGNWMMLLCMFDSMICSSHKVSFYLNILVPITLFQAEYL